MRHFTTLLPKLRERPDPELLVRGFRPPRRFATKEFAAYRPQHPTQEDALQRLQALSLELQRSPTRGWRLFRRRERVSPAAGIYLDGGFGVGKTHLLASLWAAAPEPRAYLSFDELMYFVGLVGPGPAALAFRGYRLIAIDEWELDDPGNLKMALAFLRGVLEQNCFIAVTSNTLPLELGAGRFSQKDFRGELEEMAGAFEVLRLEGKDYRRRSFAGDATGAHLLALGSAAEASTDDDQGGLRTSFPALQEVLASIHPIRYRDLARALDSVLIEGLGPFSRLPDALRWVHFIDSVYDAGVPLLATGSVGLSELFPRADLMGPYGKKLSRSLSRLQELLMESAARMPLEAESA